MRYDPEKHHRRSMRLKGYDYSQDGAYAVTICTFQRECTLGEVSDDGVMTINAWGEIILEEWLKTPLIRSYVDLDAFVIMPNHMHGIIVITESQNRQPNNLGTTRRVVPKERPRGAVAGSLGAIISQFKAVVTKRINHLRGTPQASVWQDRFHDNIIWNEPMLNRFRFYIENNPSQWAADRHHPDNIG
jgi:putative transposase